MIRAVGPSLTANGSPLPHTLQDPILEVRTAKGELIAQNDDWKLNSDNDRTWLEATGLAPKDDRESVILAELPAGAYTAQVRGAGGGTGTAIYEIYAGRGNGSSGGASRALNVSTRGHVGVDDDVLIGGMIITGDIADRVVVRAIGPDVGVPDSLQNPTLELHDQMGNLLASNNDWRDAQEGELLATQLAPKDDRDAAIVMNLIPGAYTAVVHGLEGATGIGLVEFYDLTN